MNISLHLEGLTAAQVAAIAAVLDGSAPAAAAPNVKPATAKTEPKTEPKTEAKSDATEITVERLTELGKAFAGKNGRDAFVELLGGFGAKNISGVPAEQRAALLAKLEA